MQYMVVEGLLGLALAAIAVALLLGARRNHLQVKALQALRADNAALEAIQQRIFSTLSHDVRGPVASAWGVIHLGQSSLPHAGHALAQLTHALHLLDTLQLWANVQLRAWAPQPAATEVALLVQDAQAPLLALAANKQISLINRVSSDIFVFTDYNMIQIILQQLIHNSIKFTFHGGYITLECEEVEPDAAAGQRGEVILRVTDTGVGIPAQRQTGILEGIAPSRGTAGEKGGGMGLRLCGELAGANAARLWCVSPVLPDGGGTTFYLALPTGAAQ